ncbi:MAG: LysR family transcriptional regulator [Verrucomicrobiaceae bacterium]|nr:MAG: LysR family transcriptional regulator [Verrucomicrobiaceae bacterium]
MMIRHLPYFAITAEEEHFQRAADRLGITQSALSRRIQILERDLGFKLFDRLARGVQLTRAGLSFYKDVKKFQRDLDRAKERAGNVASGTHGTINLAINPAGVSNPLIQQLIRFVRQQHPALAINIKVLMSEDQIEGLHRADVDVGIAYQVAEDRTLNFVHLAWEKLVFAIPTDHRLATKKDLRFADFDRETFVWPARDQNPRMYDRMIAIFNARGVSPHIGVEVESTESTMAIVGAGVAIGLVATHQDWQCPANVVLREPADFQMTLPLTMVWRADNRSPSLELLNQAALQLLGGISCSMMANSAGETDPTILNKAENSRPT